MSCSTSSTSSITTSVCGTSTNHQQNVSCSLLGSIGLGLLLPQIPSPLSIHAQIQRHNTSRAETLARTYHSVMTSLITSLHKWEKGDTYTISSPNVFDVCLDQEEKDAIVRAVRIGFEAKGWVVDGVPKWENGFGSLRLDVKLKAPVGLQRAVDVFLWKSSHGCECKH
ncbi:hypothetical protein HK097_007632 [Rhizophlyctis rosea]|uniref:Uncharacterized protein n=1 Tax=Rhizophlyctis rosea TaxID=64517 RepID=A0AAD5X538_9FUNG|nr:hypothetical protein HK097_007632 [Rhizophlyctis rosea]